VLARLKEQRDRIQAQLDRWILRGFRVDDATREETAQTVTKVADLNRAIAEEEAKDRKA
jgi:hypothetical protein